MADEMTNLRAFVEKAANADLLREMIGFAAYRLRRSRSAARLAGYGEKSPERRAARNGCRHGGPSHDVDLDQRVLRVQA